MGEMPLSVARQIKLYLWENNTHCIRIEKLIPSTTTGRQARGTPKQRRAAIFAAMLDVSRARSHTEEICGLLSLGDSGGEK